jgi:hypothetical protein
LSYGRSRFFTFLFFMLQVSRIRLCEYNKSCSTLHNESNKIDFAFFLIAYDFLRILQDSAKFVTLFKKQLTRRSLELLIPHKYTLGSQFRPCRELGACNVVPGWWPARLRPKSGQPAAMGGRAWVGDGLPVPGVGVLDRQTYQEGT